MRKSRIALCDWNAEYVFKLEEYLRSVEYLPFTVDVYTEYERYAECKDKYHYEGAVIAEGFCEEELIREDSNCLILTEERTQTDRHVYRYQPADMILQEIMEMISASGSIKEESFKLGKGCCLIGMYSPVRRCLQTSFALTMGQLLAKRNRVLYMSFETYSGVIGRFAEGSTSGEDMADLLYYYKNMPEEFSMHFKAVINRINGLECVPSAFSYFDVQQISGEDWEGFLEKVRETGSYEYIILDLSDNIQGNFSLLKSCSKIYSMQFSDANARAKKKHYERLLQELHYKEIPEKTRWCTLPQFAYLPDSPEQLLYSELAEYAREILKEDMGEGSHGR